MKKKTFVAPVVKVVHIENVDIVTESQGNNTNGVQADGLNKDDTPLIWK